MGLLSLVSGLNVHVYKTFEVFDFGAVDIHDQSAVSWFIWYNGKCLGFPFATRKGIPGKLCKSLISQLQVAISENTDPDIEKFYVAGLSGKTI